MAHTLTNAEKLLFAAASQNGGQPVDIGRSIGMSEAVAEQAAIELNKGEYAILGYGGLTVLDKGHALIAELTNTLKRMDDDKRINRL